MGMSMLETGTWDLSTRKWTSRNGICQTVSMNSAIPPASQRNISLGHKVLRLFISDSWPRNRIFLLFGLELELAQAVRPP